MENLIAPLIDKESDSDIESFKTLFRISSSDDTEINSKKEKIFKTHFGNIEGLLSHLNVDEKHGLNIKDTKDIEYRKIHFGTNEIEEDEPRSFFEFVFESLGDPMLRVLIIASIISLAIGIYEEGWSTGWMEGSAIFLAVFIVASINSLLNWKKYKQFRTLRLESKIKNVFVKRNGKKNQIDQEELLVGDLLFAGIGDILPIDGILIHGNLSIDESPLNGESELIKKKSLREQININSAILYGGTMVKEGEGIVLVCAVGKLSSIGMNRELNKESMGENEIENLTPLQAQLRSLSEKIGYIGWIMSLFIFVIIITKEILWRAVNNEEIFNFALVDRILGAFIISVTVIVVAIPEGLPMAVIIALAFTLQKMKDENSFVKHLDATETMGNVNNICTDKTGTLTEGDMSVSRFFISLTDFQVDDTNKISADALKLIGEVISHNITAHSEKKDGKIKALGNMTERALLQFLIDKKIPYESKEKFQPFLRLPFNSEHKFMISIWPVINEKYYRLYIKGAPEKIYDKCSKFYKSIINKFEVFSTQARDKFNKQQELYADESLRTLAIGYKDLGRDEIDELLSKFPDKDINFYSGFLKDINLICIFGIGDSPRQEIEKSIQQCSNAGIIVRMITGDNIKTAISIAKRVEIINSDQEFKSVERYLLYKKQKNHHNTIDHIFGKDEEFIKNPVAIEGNEFLDKSGFIQRIDEKGKMIWILDDPEKFRNITKNLKVIARASPLDKYILTMGLKKIDENIVAVTGDGTNDAPALKSAHIGLAMGIRGTDIAKDAADIILLDDSFKSVVTAIKYGRNIYDSIRKFLQFQLTTNIVAVFMTLLGGIVLRDAPLNAIQMLWVNLIMDSFASLALATEPPTDDLLKRRPYKKSASIITTMMIINIVSQSIFQIVVLIVILFYGDIIFDVPSDRDLSHLQWPKHNGYHFTIFFNIFVFMQVFNSLNSRKLTKHEKNVFEGITRNYYYIFIQLLIVIGQILIVTFGGRAVRTRPLSPLQHLLCILIASLTLFQAYLIKFLPFFIEEEIREKKSYLFSRTRKTISRTLPTRKVFTR